MDPMRTFGGGNLAEHVTVDNCRLNYIDLNRSGQASQSLNFKFSCEMHFGLGLQF